MDKVRKLVNEAPLSVRLVPAGLAFVIASSALGLVDSRLVVGILALVGFVMGGVVVLSGGLRRPRQDSGWYCFEVHSYSEDDSISEIRSFLIERSRTVDAEFRIVEHYSGGRRRVVIGVSGGEDEGLVLVSVVSAMLKGKVSLKPISDCSLINKINLIINNNNVLREVLWIGYDLTQPVPREIYLSREDIEGHVGVFGSTGSGKSTTLRVIAERAPQHFSVVVIDWTGEHGKRLVDKGFVVVDPRVEGGFDIISCYGSRGWQEVLELFIRALDLSEPQAYMLEQLLKKGVRNINDIYNNLDLLVEETRWDREVKKALTRKIGTLIRSSGHAFKDGCLPLKGRIIIDLSNIIDVFSRRALANIVLARLFLQVRESGGPPVIVVVDEAHNLVRGDGRDILNIILAESRKFGLHIVYATQSPHIIGDLALLNTNTKIVHAIKSQKDKRVIIDSLGLSEEWMTRLDKLSRGTALLQSPSYPQPVLISVQA